MTTPTSTYRVQIGPSFGLSQVTGIISYLAELGISHLYASPLFKARAGSPHGYDVVDFSCLNPSLGSEADFEEMVRALHRNGIGLLLDIVPNHMAASPENRWWSDVLRNGPRSAYASYFDIDWDPPHITLRNRVILPFLGSPYGDALENGELQIQYDEQEGLLLDYHGFRLPLNLLALLAVLQLQVRSLSLEAGPPILLTSQLQDLIQETSRRLEYPQPESTPALCRRLQELHQSSPEFRTSLAAALSVLNGRKDSPSSFNGLHDLLDTQAYRLTFWRKAREESNYRRFFNINDLVGTRVEEPEVFDDIHRFTLRLIREGRLDGLRIDHIDGLQDPVGYLRRLQAEISGENPFYVVVEKILSIEEEIPPEWPVCGTTGYDFLNQLNGLFVDPHGLQRLDRFYRQFTGLEHSAETVIYQKKKEVITRLFAGETRSLYEHLKRLADADRHGRDLPVRELNQALIEVSACLPVYRTYVRDAEISEADRACVARALQEAKRRSPGITAPVLRFFRRVLHLDFTGVSADQQGRWLRFVRRWQQFTSPVTAKGVEDTAFYVYNRLVSLNEVGGEPGRGALDLEEFHRYNLRKLERWPSSLNATSTHDTKRSEDVRARIDVLSEIAEEWGSRAAQWAVWNQELKKKVANRPVPDPNEEVLIYQTLVGAWPLLEAEIEELRVRLKAYLLKAAREAKENTRWGRPNLAHERALESFVEAILQPFPRNQFYADFLTFQSRIAFFGALNSISQLLLKAGAPGVPDFYQGNELWDFSLVDPDNRRPVDFELRAELLRQLRHEYERDPGGLPVHLLQNWRDGRLKLFVTWRSLQLRRRFKNLFESGSYQPIIVEGRLRCHLCSYLRRAGEQSVLVVAPRWFSGLVSPPQFPVGTEIWSDAQLLLPPGGAAKWVDAFTQREMQAAETRSGQALALAELLAVFPWALLYG